MKPTNKGSRNEIEKRKHKKRCENLGVEPETNYCYKAQSKPCSCFLCRNKKYKREKYKTDIDIIDVKFYILNYMENNLVFRIGAFKRNGDFCVYNPFNVQLSDEPLQLSEITLENNSFLEKVKSYTWSCNCKFFFIINTNNIIIGNTQNNEAFLSHNLSKEVFQEYLNAFKN